MHHWNLKRIFFISNSNRIAGNVACGCLSYCLVQNKFERFRNCTDSHESKMRWHEMRSTTKTHFYIVWFHFRAVLIFIMPAPDSWQCTNGCQQIQRQIFRLMHTRWSALAVWWSTIVIKFLQYLKSMRSFLGHGNCLVVTLNRVNLTLTWLVSSFDYLCSLAFLFSYRRWTLCRCCHSWGCWRDRHQNEIWQFGLYASRSRQCQTKFRFWLFRCVHCDRIETRNRGNNIVRSWNIAMWMVGFW